MITASAMVQQNKDARRLGFVFVSDMKDSPTFSVPLLRKMARSAGMHTSFPLTLKSNHYGFPSHSIFNQYNVVMKWLLYSFSKHVRLRARFHFGTYMRFV